MRLSLVVFAAFVISMIGLAHQATAAGGIDPKELDLDSIIQRMEEENKKK